MTDPKQKSGLELKKIKKVYPNGVEVIHGVDLDIKKGEFIVFVGPSGCGKSTLLRMIAGLEDITGGDLYIDGNQVNDLPAAMRGIAMVFQTYALYPHMTVYDNMAFAMRLAKASTEEIDKKVRDAAEMLQLTPYLGRLPKALSGGQRQRVAIGRAIVREPQVFLFDKPLSNLDAGLRVQTRIEIANLKETMVDTTMIYVTHDQVEAMTLADRIVVLSAGYIEQVGSPLELYTNPANLFVARFIGSPSMNILHATIVETGDVTMIQTQTGSTIKAPIASSAEYQNKPAMFGVRPEDLVLTDETEGAIEGKVKFVESLGEVTQLHFDVPGAEEPVIAKIPGIVHYHKGDTVRVKATPEKMHLFNDDGLSFKYL